MIGQKAIDRQEFTSASERKRTTGRVMSGEVRQRDYSSIERLWAEEHRRLPEPKPPLVDYIASQWQRHQEANRRQTELLRQAVEFSAGRDQQS